MSELTQTEALKALVHEMEYVLSCINEDKIPFDGDDFHEALRLGKEALAQPEQEPMAVLFEDGSVIKYEYLEFVPEKSGQRVQMLYTTPPQRKPLTDEELDLICEKALFCRISFQQFARSIEAAHGIKG